MKGIITNIRNLLFTGILIFNLPFVLAQNTSDSLQGQNLYRPSHSKQLNDKLADSLPESSAQVVADSLDPLWLAKQDSIVARLKFVQDSLLARDIFVRDSIARRIRILDSLNFLRSELPQIFDASLRTFNDDLIIAGSEIRIIGDSMLSNYTYTMLPFALESEYTPWNSSIALSASFKPVVDTLARKITYIQSPKLSASYKYEKGGTLMLIEAKSSILRRSSGQVYRVPIDSVFFGPDGKVRTIKRYIRYHSVKPNYRPGAHLYNELKQVKQYSYSGGSISTYQIVNFCERSSASSAQKVCSVVNYGLSRSGTNYILSRESDPVNNFADGTFTYEFDSDYTLVSLAFENKSKSEQWKTFVEVNELGYVSRYIYQNKGWVHQTLLINYYLNDPRAKHKIEKITCIFEDDGISYYQQNNTTGKSRRRNKLTGEWSPWE